MKQCTKCNLDKELTEFTKNQYSCKSCNRKINKEYQIKNQQYLKEYRLKNKEKSKEYNKKYVLENKDKIAEKTKRWNLKNKDYRVNYNKQKLKNDPLFKLTHNIRSLILLSIKTKGYSKKSKTNQILGCDYETFKAHLEKQFTKGMDWTNQGEWHLDHIYPVSLARNEKHLIELNHYTNFQPLWKKDNISKGNKIIEKQLFLI